MPRQCPGMAMSRKQMFQYDCHAWPAKKWSISVTASKHQLPIETASHVGPMRKTGHRQTGTEITFTPSRFTLTCVAIRITTECRAPISTPGWPERGRGRQRFTAAAVDAAPHEACYGAARQSRRAPDIALPLPEHLPLHSHPLSDSVVSVSCRIQLLV